MVIHCSFAAHKNTNWVFERVSGTKRQINQNVTSWMHSPVTCQQTNIKCYFSVREIGNLWCLSVLKHEITNKLLNKMIFFFSWTCSSWQYHPIMVRKKQRLMLIPVGGEAFSVLFAFWHYKSRCSTDLAGGPSDLQQGKCFLHVCVFEIQKGQSEPLSTKPP